VSRRVSLASGIGLIVCVLAFFAIVIIGKAKGSDVVLVFAASGGLGSIAILAVYLILRGMDWPREKQE
jgi:NADPH-dependent curcumin reductase CurA